MPPVKPVPDGHHTVTPYLVVDNAAEAIAFYTRAFGATELYRMPGPDGRIMHAEILLGDCPIMLCDPAPDMGAQSPRSFGGSAASLFLYVPDVDAAFARATAAGATVKAPLMNMFWGDRYGSVDDPYGYTWQMATHVEDVAPEEMAKRMNA
jgi:PhnB protein